MAITVPSPPLLTPSPLSDTDKPSRRRHWRHTFASSFHQLSWSFDRTKRKSAHPRSRGRQALPGTEEDDDQGRGEVATGCLGLKTENCSRATPRRDRTDIRTHNTAHCRASCARCNWDNSTDDHSVRTHSATFPSPTL